MTDHAEDFGPRSPPRQPIPVPTSTYKAVPREPDRSVIARDASDDKPLSLAVSFTADAITLGDVTLKAVDLRAILNDHAITYPGSVTR